MRYRLDPMSSSGVSLVSKSDGYVPYFKGGAGKPSLVDSVNGKHGAVILGLSDLSDVVITGTPSDNQALAFDSATGKFIPQTLAGGSGITAVVEDTSPQLGGDLDTNGNDILLSDGNFVQINPEFQIKADNANIGDGYALITGPTTPQQRGFVFRDSFYIAGYVGADGSGDWAPEISGHTDQLNFSTIGATGTGHIRFNAKGELRFRNGGIGVDGIFDMSNIATSNKTFAFPNASGTIALDEDVVHDTGNETIAGVKTFSSDPIIPDEAYGAGWDGVLEPPTKNAVYDKIETLGGGEVPRNEITLTDYSNQNDLTSPDYGLTRMEANGTGATATFAERGITLVSGTTSSSYGRTYLMFQNANASWWEDKFYGLKPRFRAKWSASINTASTGYLFIGITNELGIAPANTIKHIGLHGSIADNALTWYASHADGTTLVQTDVTSAVTGLAEYAITNLDRIYDVLFDYDGSQIKFYMNGVLLATHTTSLPTGDAGGVGRYVASGVVKNTAGTTSKSLCIYYAKTDHLLYTE